MSYLACHVQKFSAGSVAGLEKHILRKNRNYSNACIDKEKGVGNYDILSRKQVEISKSVKEKIAKSGARARKDSVVYCSVIVSSDNDFFEKAGAQNTMLFFKKAAQWLADNLAGGSDNVVNATVHMDETTPHLHFGFVPLTQDGRLCAKEMLSRRRLQELQDLLPKHLQDRGFQIERGRKNVEGRKHLTTDEYKAELKATLDTQKLVSSDFQKEYDRFLAVANKNYSEGLFGLGEPIIKLPVDEAKHTLKVLEKAKRIVERAQKAEAERDKALKRAEEAEPKAKAYDQLEKFIPEMAFKKMQVQAEMNERAYNQYFRGRFIEEKERGLEEYGIEKIVQWQKEREQDREDRARRKTVNRTHQRARDDYDYSR